MRNLPSQNRRSTRWLRLGKLPCAIKNFLARPIEAHRVVPAGKDRKAVRGLAIAAAELDSDRPVRILFRRDVVERIGVLIVLHEISFGVVEGDRPETVDGHIFHVEIVLPLFLLGTTLR